MAVLKKLSEVKKIYLIKPVKQLKGPRSCLTGIGGLFLWGHRASPIVPIARSALIY
jgi:hypothetical protein